MRIIGKILLGLVVLLVVAVGVVYALSSSRLGRKWNVAPKEITVPTDSASIARGQHLVEAVTGCVDCHGENLGGTAVPMGPLGTFSASNLTSGKGGVQFASTGQWELAIRHGLRPDGSPLLMMPAEAYRYLSDADLGAILAYIRSVPPVDNELPPTEVGPIGRLVAAREPGHIMAAAIVDHETVRPASVTPGRTVEYGQYLAGIGGCTSCHGPDLKGGLQFGPPGTPPSADLSSTGKRAGWTEAQFFETIRTGVRPDGSALNLFMPWKFYRHMTDEELGAIWDFLQTVK
jgi:mono/diheme cytochrome c family protein